MHKSSNGCQCCQRRVALSYPHCAAYLLRDNDAPEVVDPSDNSGCFHVQNILSRGGGRIAHSGPRPPQGFSALAERRVAPAVPPRRTIAAWWGTWLLFEKATGIIPCAHILSGMVNIASKLNTLNGQTVRPRRRSCTSSGAGSATTRRTSAWKRYMRRSGSPMKKATGAGRGQSVPYRQSPAETERQANNHEFTR